MYTTENITQAQKGTKLGYVFVVMWMDLQSVMKNEVSQKEKNIITYHKLMHMYGIQKSGPDEHICRAAIEMEKQRKDLWTQWVKGRVGQIERVALIYLHYHV